MNAFIDGLGRRLRDLAGRESLRDQAILVEDNGGSLTSALRAAELGVSRFVLDRDWKGLDALVDSLDVNELRLGLKLQGRLHGATHRMLAGLQREHDRCVPFEGARVANLYGDTVGDKIVAGALDHVMRSHHDPRSADDVEVYVKAARTLGHEVVALGERVRRIEPPAYWRGMVEALIGVVDRFAMEGQLSEDEERIYDEARLYAGAWEEPAAVLVTVAGEGDCLRCEEVRPLAIPMGDDGDRGWCAPCSVDELAERNERECEARDLARTDAHAHALQHIRHNVAPSWEPQSPGALLLREIDRLAGEAKVADVRLRAASIHHSTLEKTIAALQEGALVWQSREPAPSERFPNTRTFSFAAGIEEPTQPVCGVCGEGLDAHRWGNHTFVYPVTPNPIAEVARVGAEIDKTVKGARSAVHALKRAGADLMLSAGPVWPDG